MLLVVLELVEDSVVVDGLDDFLSDDPFAESPVDPESFLSEEPPESERLSVR